MGEVRLIIQPDEEEGEGAEVLVDGLIGGHPYRFLLDTGAAKTSVPLDDYTATFPVTETNASSGVFATSTDDLITVPGIELGPISRRDFTLARSRGQYPGARNLIGMDLLKDYCCHFVFEENRVVVDAGDVPESGVAWQALLLDRKAHPYVEVEFGALKAQAVWDTGASITIVDTSFVRRHPDCFQPVGQSTGTDSTGTQVETPTYRMAATMIGQQAFPAHKVAAVDLSQVNSTIDVPMVLILGYSMLREANWLFDFPRQRWAISKRLDNP